MSNLAADWLSAQPPEIKNHTKIPLTQMYFCMVCLSNANFVETAHVFFSEDKCTVAGIDRVACEGAFGGMHQSECSTDTICCWDSSIDAAWCYYGNGKWLLDCVYSGLALPAQVTILISGQSCSTLCSNWLAAALTFSEKEIAVIKNRFWKILYWPW